MLHELAVLLGADPAAVTDAIAATALHALGSLDVPVMTENGTGSLPTASRSALHWRQFRDAPAPGAVFIGVDCGVDCVSARHPSGT